MPVRGPFSGSRLGGGWQAFNIAVNNGVATVAMASLNAGWCARFMAHDTRDITSLVFSFSAVTAAGVITLRIETIDTTTGKPSGTLYDASASKTFTPVVGFQTVTFASLPTAGLVAGTEYAIVLLTTTGGTTMTLRSHIAAAYGSAVPTQVLTAADGTTRSNFAAVANGIPHATIIFEDGVEEAGDMLPFATLDAYNIFSTAGAGAKLIVPAGVTLLVDAIEFVCVITGTPAGDLRVRIFDSTDTLVTGASQSAGRNSLSGTRRAVVAFDSTVSLAPGVYRIVFDSASSANSSNCYTLRTGISNSVLSVSAACIATNTADVTASPIVWTDTAIEAPAIGLVLNSLKPTARQSFGQFICP